MHIGHYISGTAHVALLGWLAFGSGFAAEPLPLEATEVSVISGEEFAALMAAQQSPQSLVDVAQPSSPEVTPDAPNIDAQSENAPSLTTPDSAPAPDVEASPDVSQITPPPAPAEVTDEAPVLPTPPQDVAVLAPDVAERAVPQPADRVAPEAVEAPPPDALPDPDVREAARPDEVGKEEREAEDATAPEAAATEIVTEAETPARAPENSLRPPARRPSAPVQTAAPAPDPAPAPTEETRDAVADALAQALAAPSSAPSQPSGPPLSAGEKDALRVAVSNCWNVGALSTDALRTTVVVGVDMTQDGKPVVGSIRMLSSSGGPDAAANQAFEAARRAIIRCGARGYDLPQEKFDQWREIEMTFNPERMRVK